MADFIQQKASFRTYIVKVLYWLVWFFTLPWQNNPQWQRKQMARSSKMLQKVRNFQYTPEAVGEMKGEWMIPTNAPDQQRVIYYLHGGAFAMCSITTHRRLISLMARSIGCRAYAVEYTLCPEAAYPVALIQAVEGYKFLLAKGYKPENIIIAGDSAGGGLSVTTMLKLKELGIPLPGKAILLSPWTDLAGMGKSNTTASQRDPINNFALQFYGKLYVGKEDFKNPFISPIYGDLTGLPPILIQTSTTELINDDSIRLAAKARAGNVDVTVQQWYGQVHVWQIFDQMLPEAKQAIEMMGQWANA